MATVNEQLRDAAIDHQIDLSRFNNGVVRRMIAILNRTDPDLIAQLLAALDKLDPDNFTVQRLDRLLQSARDINKAAYSAIGKALPRELSDLTDYESEWQLKSLSTYAPSELKFTGVVSEQVYTAVLARPFQGRLLKEWISTLEDDRAARVRDAVRIGYVEGQSTQQIIQRLRGTRALGYSDGALEIDRRNATAVVQTALSHTANFTRDAVIAVNGDVVAAKVWVSTLDTKTSAMCRIRDGLEYSKDNKPIGHKVPWLSGPGRLHWRCRSTSSAVLKAWDALGITMPKGTRASMSGQVPEETTYSDWIKRQSAARQAEILGETRMKLMREGKADLSKFYDDKGRWLTLDQLRQRDAAVFARAGLAA